MTLTVFNKRNAFLYLVLGFFLFFIPYPAISQYIPYHQGSKWGFCDTAKNIIIPPRYESLDLFNHGHARILINNRWGFIDTVGNEFFLADSVSFIAYYGEFILITNGKKNALLDAQFKYIVPFKYDAILDFDHSIAPVRNGDKWGYIDKTGKEIVPLIYGPGYHGKITENVTWQMLDGKAGYIDTIGKTVIPFIYDLGTPFLNGFAQVRKGGKWIYINHQGKEMNNLKYDYVGPFFDGLSAVKLSGKTGFMDTSGTLVIPIQYDNTGFFHDSMAGIVMNDQWGYINSKGETIIKPKYTYGGDFQEGFANVKAEDDWMMINKKGKKVLRGEYDYIIRVDTGLYIIKKKGLAGVAGFTGKNKGKILIPMDYKYITYLGNGLFILSKDGKSGIVDKTNKILIPFLYDSIEANLPGLFYAKRGTKYGYINIKGKEFWE